jgi:hypothetical protein
MTLDIRLPMGLLFTLIGLLLVIYGLANATTSMAAGINVNTDWGAILIVFGISMLALARRRTIRLSRAAP